MARPKSEKRKALFNMRIDEDVRDKFRTKCKQDGFAMTSVLQTLMQAYLDGVIELK